MALAATRAKAGKAKEAARETADLTLRLLEHLASTTGQCGVTELAQAFGTSKATIHRHLRTLARRDFVRQDAITQRYEPGIKLMVLGEAMRGRFDILGAAREPMMALRDASGQAVTLSALVEGQVMVMDLVQGHTAVEFGIRPGTRMTFHASAHGKVALAWGGEAPVERSLAIAKASGGVDAAAFRRQLAAIRRQGWATAANEVLFGMNALAAPVFDHRGTCAGAVAIVGSTQFIGARPDKKQIAMVSACAARISHNLGYRTA